MAFLNYRVIAVKVYDHTQCCVLHVTMYKKRCITYTQKHATEIKAFSLMHDYTHTHTHIQTPTDTYTCR